jgi:hypothetical protein
MTASRGEVIGQSKEQLLYSDERRVKGKEKRVKGR